MDKILSVVIPSYNVEQYLEGTLTSFIDERIMSHIEILIVDDGSKDSTAEIGTRYMEQYKESIRLISKKNGGHGSTINCGIRECKGRYFKVVDGDDWVDTEGFVALVEGLKDCQADFVVTNYYEVDDQTKDKTKREFTYLATGKDIPFEQAASYGVLPMHALVIRTDILKQHKIQLDEHCFYVDVEYVIYPVPYINTVRYLDIYVYMYRLALATQSVSMKGFQKNIQNHIDVIYHLTDFYNEYAKENPSGAKRRYISDRIARMIDDQVSIFLSFGQDNMDICRRFQEFDRMIKQKNQEIYELSGGYRRVLRWLRKTNFKGYKWLVKLSNIRNKKGTQ